MDHGKYSKSFKIKDREPLEISPNDAKERNLKKGDIVKLFNNRGACLAGVIIDDKVRPGVVQISTGAWYDPEDPKEPNSLCKHGNPNVLTPDKGTSKLGDSSGEYLIMEFDTQESLTGNFIKKNHWNLFIMNPQKRH